jgi:hypothetical protein
MVNLTDILPHIAEENGWGKKWERTKIWLKWNEIFSEPLSKNVQPARVADNDILFLLVEDNIWMQELSFQKLHLIDKINGLLTEKSKIKDIRFQLGIIKQTTEDNIIKDSTLPPLNPEIVDMISGIHDAGIREALLSFYKISIKNMQL